MPSSVCSTIRSSVPCRTSVLSRAPALPLATPKEYSFGRRLSTAGGQTTGFSFTLPFKGAYLAPPRLVLRPSGGEMMVRRVLLALSLFVALLVASPALAQTGQINGSITDNTGAVVPGATVRAIEAATGLSRDTVTGADGRYTFAAMRPTTYDIT